MHMIGIGGAGMSGLAIVMAQLGYQITGSDRRPGAVADKLKSLGVTVHVGHEAINVGDVDLVVASAAVAESNPEMVAAREKGISIISRAEMLGRLMAGNYGIAVAGTHGKTTTTSMLALVLEEAVMNPTILIGGNVEKLGGNAVLGDSDLFLAEACEAFNSFLELSPKMAIVTNVDADHLDCHGSLEGVKDSFRTFLSHLQEGGCAIVCADCENALSVIPAIKEKVITYGLHNEADVRAYDVDVTSPEPSFKVSAHGNDLGEFRLHVPGMHNVLNALGVIAAACELGVEVDLVKSGLLEFYGAGRRFDKLGSAQGITIIDDYAHHPTEVKATLDAAQSWGCRIVLAFQPHLYSRTQLFCDDFVNSLKAADVVFVTEIYAAREEPVPGVSGAMIVDRINVDQPGKARFVADKALLPDELVAVLRDGDMLIVMGAGDIRAVGESVLEHLQTTGE